MLGNGNGSFQSASTYSTGLNPVGIKSGDFNNDSNMDIVVTNISGNSVSVFLGVGDGTFGTASSFTTGFGPLRVKVSDFDLNGNLDIVVTNSNDNNIGILNGNGDATFQTQVVRGTGLSPSGIVIGDINELGFNDIIVSNSGSNTIGVFINENLQPITTIPINNNILLEISIENQNTLSLTGISFIDNIPNGLNVTSVATTCNGIKSFTSTSVTLSNGNIGSTSTCIYRSILKTISVGNTINNVVVSSNEAFDGISNNANLQITLRIYGQN